MSELQKIYNEIKILTKRIDNECGDIPCSKCPLNEEVKVKIKGEIIFKTICSLMYSIG